MSALPKHRIWGFNPTATNGGRAKTHLRRAHTFDSYKRIIEAQIGPKLGGIRLQALKPEARKVMRVRHHLFLRERDAGWTFPERSQQRILMVSHAGTLRVCRYLLERMDP